MIAALARQHTAELGLAASRHQPRYGSDARSSLRVRTGWALVDLGLQLATRPGPLLARRPRPAGS